MANRSTLHISKAEEFKGWLKRDGWELEDPKGIWEEIRARKGKRVFIAFRRKDVKEHLSVSDRDCAVVKAFINSQRKPKTNAEDQK